MPVFILSHIVQQPPYARKDPINELVHVTLKSRLYSITYSWHKNRYCAAEANDIHVSQSYELISPNPSLPRIVSAHLHVYSWCVFRPSRYTQRHVYLPVY